MRQIILDTETTGLHVEEGHKIIEIGCIELVNRKLTGKKFHQYINPQRKIEEEALNVHGITNTFLENKPVFSDIATEFMEFIMGAELIIHNAPFDLGFLHHELKATPKNWKPIETYCRIIDTLVLARKLHVGQRNNLDALCKRYSINYAHRELHGALLDAHLLAQVYLAMTGGQVSLFDHLQTGDSEKININIMASTSTQRNLLIQRANPDELLCHENILKNLSEKGQCVWTEDLKI